MPEPPPTGIEGAAAAGPEPTPPSVSAAITAKMAVSFRVINKLHFVGLESRAPGLFLRAMRKHAHTTQVGQVLAASGRPRDTTVIAPFTPTRFTLPLGEWARSHRVGAPPAACDEQFGDN
ncbi:hypothetical protein GCM10010528_14970 [Gordonia defluvii]|uniref:Uncharacterized protein n=1 Tax=Gordonia defluvii TaxID=283718 RepID=A0ABP6LCS0_9ACTN